MRQRITLLHLPEDAIDPASIKITKDSLEVLDLKAAREDRLTFGFDELPQEIRSVLEQSHELHIRYVNRIFYESISPFLARLSPGLHVFYSPQRKKNYVDALCPLIHKIFSPKSQRLCQSPGLSFTSLPAQRFHQSTAYEYYLPESQYNKFALVDYIHAKCPASNSFDCRRVEKLRYADSIDIDFDAISRALTITAFWRSQIWDLDISNKEPKNRLEVGILSNEKPLETEELKLSGFLTVVGEDTTPSPALFDFPSRHHPLSSPFSAEFLKPTGLHPSLQLKVSNSKPPLEGRTCSLHAYVTLPRVIFADKYQLSDPLFMASKNLSTIHYITTPVDLEAPEYTMSLWGSSLLLELSLPALQPDPWTAEIPLHLRYLPPTPSGYSKASVPWPILFWACTADEGSKFTINPFDRVNLGYDGLFGPRTMFYHLSPNLTEAWDKNVQEEGYNFINVPVLNTSYIKWVELGTAAAILFGFGLVMWRLLVVLREDGYGHRPTPKVEKTQ